MRQTRGTLPSKGFTLVELVVVLALFSMVLLFCYQAFSASVAVQNRVSAAIIAQTQLRTTYGALRSALESGGSITGDARQLTVNLSDASSRWLLDQGVKRVRFSLTDSGQLWQQLDGRLPSELLLEQARGVQFSYLTAKGERVSEWQALSNPQAVVLTGLSSRLEGADTTPSAAVIEPEPSVQWLFLTR